MQTNKASGLSLAIIIVWLIFMIVAWVFIVAALDRQEWVSGTEASGRGLDVGVFRQCVQTASGEHCSRVDGSDINIPIWQAAAAFFVVGLILLSVVIILGFFCICFLQLLPWTKALLSITNLFMIIAIFLIPIGFAWLDDRCPSGDNEAQCGLVCDGSGTMDFFKLCSPFNVGRALWVMIVGLILLFVGSWVIACLQTRTVYYTQHHH